MRETVTESEAERERETERVRETARDRDRKTDRQTDRQFCSIQYPLCYEQIKKIHPYCQPDGGASPHFTTINQYTIDTQQAAITIRLLG